MNELERLKSIKRWLKGKNLPEAEKDIMRRLIKVREEEILLLQGFGTDQFIPNKPTSETKKNTEHLKG